MNKTTMNSLTTFIPILIIPLACIFLVFNPYFNTKKIGIILAPSAFPIQGLFILLRKNVFLKHWLGKKEKIFDGLLWIAIGSIIIFLYLNKPTFTGTWESTTSDLSRGDKSVFFRRFANGPAPVGSGLRALLVKRCLLPNKRNYF